MREKNPQYNKGFEVRLGKMKIMSRNVVYSLPTSAKECGSMMGGKIEIHNRRLSFAQSVCVCLL